MDLAFSGVVIDAFSGPQHIGENAV